MTNPTPLSTAGSAEDLLRRARAGCAFQFVGDGSDNQEVDTVATNSLLEELADEIERLRQPVAGNASDLVKALEEALTPSGETKAAYIGEFKFSIEHGEEGETRDIQVPWDTIKEIMQSIRVRALTRHCQGEKA